MDSLLTVLIHSAQSSPCSVFPQHSVHRTYSHPLPGTWLGLFRCTARCQVPEAAIVTWCEFVGQRWVTLAWLSKPRTDIDKQNYTPPPNPQGFPAPARLTIYLGSTTCRQAITIYPKSHFLPHGFLAWQFSNGLKLKGKIRFGLWKSSGKLNSLLLPKHKTKQETLTTAAEDCPMFTLKGDLHLFLS